MSRKVQQARTIAVAIQGISTGFALAAVVKNPRDVKAWGKLTVCVGSAMQTLA